MSENHQPENVDREQAYRESLIKEIMGRLSISLQADPTGSYDTGQCLTVKLFDGETELSSDYVYLSDLRRD